MSMNRVELSGRLCKDIELKTFGEGKDQNAVTRFNLAIDDGKDAAGEKVTQFIQCVAWGRLAEILKEYTGKVDQLIVWGKLQNNNYEKDGQMVYQTQVYVQGLDLTARRQDAEPEPEEKPKYSGSKYTRSSRK